MVERDVRVGKTPDDPRFEVALVFFGEEHVDLWRSNRPTFAVTMLSGARDVRRRGLHSCRVVMVEVVWLSRSGFAGPNAGCAVAPCAKAHREKTVESRQYARWQGIAAPALGAADLDDAFWTLTAGWGFAQFMIVTRADGWQEPRHYRATGAGQGLSLDGKLSIS